MFDVDIDLAFTRFKSRVSKVLLVAFYDSNGVPSIVENLTLIQKLSAYPITIVNLAEHRADTGHLKLPAYLNLAAFDAIIIHNTVAFNVDNLISLDALTDVKLASFEGAKIILKQDEHFRFAEFASYAKSIDVDVIFSLMPRSEVPKTYDVYLPGVKIRHMLTGYVTPSMRRRFNLSLPRPVDLGYRGSIMPISYGRLCYEKRKIGYDVGRLLDGRGLSLDISSRWQDRIGGDGWFQFLASCKGVLGVESGSGIFDIDGTLKDRCAQIESRLGPGSEEDEEYVEAYLNALGELEDQVRYYAISPRHFEAMSVGAVQILFPGQYTNRMQSRRHYFPLSRDYKNLDEAVDLILDESARTRMALAAYEEVVLSRENWIEQFVQEIDGQLDELLAERATRSRQCRTAGVAKNVVVLQAHEYGLDPRRDKWYGAGANKSISVHQIGILRSSSQNQQFRAEKGGLILNVPLLNCSSKSLDRYWGQANKSAIASAVLNELRSLESILRKSELELANIYGIAVGSQRMSAFTWNIKYLCDTACTLLAVGTRVEGVHALIAINLPALLPALVLKGLLNIPVMYEALEYWPEADTKQAEFEKVFWLNLERRIVKFADFCGTVSPPLARLMSRNLGVEFVGVPNCETRDSYLGARSESKSRAGHTSFLYQGNFAPHRGLEKLIKSWARVNEGADLVLRGPDNPFKRDMIALAKQMGLLNKTIFFPAPVAVEQLVATAHREGDVGIVPYEPVGANYRYCSPNKLSQYMAAGIPILANKTEFVSEVIGSSQCGVCVDFSRESDLVAAVASLCDEPFRLGCAERSASYFLDRFNWEAVSRPIYERLDAVLEGRGSEAMTVFAAGCRKPVGMAEGLIDEGVSVQVVAAMNKILPRPARSVGRWTLKVRNHRVARQVWHIVPPWLRYAIARKLRL